MERQLVYSALRTPDGTIIQSKHRHDYVTHTDANGKEYMIDGGTAYLRSSANGDEYYLAVYSDEPFEKVREYLRWGRNYDKNMNLLPATEWVLLKEITDDHLEALIVYPSVAEWIRELFVKEKEYRKL